MNDLIERMQDNLAIDPDERYRVVHNGMAGRDEQNPMDYSNGMADDRVNFEVSFASELDANLMVLRQTIAQLSDNRYPSEAEQMEYVGLQSDEVILGALSLARKKMTENPRDTLELLGELEERHAKVVSWIINQALKDDQNGPITMPSQRVLHTESEVLAGVIAEDAESGVTSVAKILQQLAEASCAASEVIIDRQLVSA